jgi:hypothetical protein
MTTFRELKLNLSLTRSGRVTLHLLCLCGDGHLGWHARGIAREFCPVCSAQRKGTVGSQFARDSLHYLRGLTEPVGFDGEPGGRYRETPGVRSGPTGP